MMSPANFIQLGIGIITAFAAVAAWRSAMASWESVKEQKCAGEQAARATTQQMEVLVRQVEALSAQSRAADEHAKTARQQAQAEAIRWSTQAHLDISNQSPRPSEVGVAFDRMRDAVVAAEFALFRFGLLPRDFFESTIQRHLEETFRCTSWLNNKKRYRDPAVAKLFDYAITTTSDGDAAAFKKLWEAITRAVNKEINEKRVNIVDGLTEEGRSMLMKAALAEFDKQYPPAADPQMNP